MAVQFRDYYETLGVSRTATADEIKQAFRKLARIHHPDVAKDKAQGEAKFKEINEAYEVLSDPAKRSRYDELGANWQETAMPPPPGGGPRRRAQHANAGAPDFEFGGTTGFSDFFESFFGGGRGFGSRGAAGTFPESDSSFAFQGQDVEADLLVTLEEALHGAVRKISLRRADDTEEAGRTNTYQVRIPPGIREGQRIRLAGQGGAGHGGGAPGDLYLRARLARHPDFSVQGSDLYCDLDVTPWEAALGAQTKIPTLDGTTSVRVPAGTSGGGKLRLRGLGLPREDGQRGDLYATVQIRMPATLSSEERALWEQMARTSKFNPRNSS